MTDADIVGKKFDERYVGLMKSLIARTRELFDAGRPLAQTVHPSAHRPGDVHAGRAGDSGCDRSLGYDTLARRPALIEMEAGASVVARVGRRLRAIGDSPAPGEIGDLMAGRFGNELVLAAAPLQPVAEMGAYGGP